MSRTVRPSLESLEDRLAPALAFAFDGSNLRITGFANSGTAILTQLASAFRVADGAAVRTFAVTGDVRVALANVPQAVVLSLGANDTAGSIDLVLGNAGNNVLALGTGTVRGNVSVRTGSGSDAVGFAPNVAGNATFDLGTGADTLGVTRTVGGHLRAVNANTVALAAATVGGNLSVVATDGIDNTVIVGAAATVAGAATFAGGAGDDTYTVLGSVAGSLVAQLGGGDNGFLLAGSVGGFLTVVGGTGDDGVLVAATSAVGGSVTLSLGNGDNTAAVRGTVGGPAITYLGGSGVDDLFFAATAVASGARLTAFLGDGDDTFTLNGTSLASALIDFGNGADTFASTVTINFPLATRNL